MCLFISIRCMFQHSEVFSLHWSWLRRFCFCMIGFLWYFVGFFIHKCNLQWKYSVYLTYIHILALVFSFNRSSDTLSEDNTLILCQVHLFRCPCEIRFSFLHFSTLSIPHLDPAFGQNKWQKCAACSLTVWKTVGKIVLYLLLLYHFWFPVLCCMNV